MSRSHYSLLTPPDFEPVGVDDVAAHLRVDTQEDLDMVRTLIPVAREHIENLTGRAAISSTWLVVSPSWAALGMDWKTRVFPLFRVPLASVSSITYFPPDDPVGVEIDAGDYHVTTTTEPGSVRLLIDPPELDDRPDAIQIEFVAGHDSPEQVPHGLRHAMRLMVADLYEERKDIAFATPQRIGALQSLTDNQRVKGWFL